MRGVVNPQIPNMDGSAILFMEQITEGKSRFYAYCRNAGDDKVSIYSLYPTTNTVMELDLAQARELSLQPKFYNAEEMEQLILDKAKLQDFLCRNFGDPTKSNVQKFNDLFSTPRFLDQQKDPLLSLTLEKTSYKLSMNLQWRGDDVSMKDFFSLSLSLTQDCHDVYHHPERTVRTRNDRCPRGRV